MDIYVVESVEYYSDSSIEFASLSYKDCLLYVKGKLKGFDYKIRPKKVADTAWINGGVAFYIHKFVDGFRVKD